MRPVLACLVAAFPLAPALAADPSPGLELSRAWTPAVTKTGTDTPLYLTIANRASEPEELLRVRCPVAHFSEKRTTDKGEEHFTSLASWSVFEDSTYPYGSGIKRKTTGEDDAVSEPRQVLAADLDGDRKPEMVLMAHDRLLIYLSPIAAIQER